VLPTTPLIAFYLIAFGCWCFLFIYFLFKHAIFELRQPITAKLCHVQFYSPSPKIFGALPQKKLGAKKHAKFGAISDNFKLWLRISPERVDISKTHKTRVSTAIPPTFGEKSSANFGSLRTKLEMCILTHSNQLFWNTIFGPLGGAAPQICTRFKIGFYFLTYFVWSQLLMLKKQSACIILFISYVCIFCIFSMSVNAREVSFLHLSAGLSSGTHHIIQKVMDKLNLFGIFGSLCIRNNWFYSKMAECCWCWF